MQRHFVILTSDGIDTEVMMELIIIFFAAAWYDLQFDNNKNKNTTLHFYQVHYMKNHALTFGMLAKV